jgi:hypothetical protein
LLSRVTNKLFHLLIDGEDSFLLSGFLAGLSGEALPSPIKLIEILAITGDKERNAFLNVNCFEDTIEFVLRKIRESAEVACHQLNYPHNCYFLALDINVRQVNSRNAPNLLVKTKKFVIIIGYLMKRFSFYCLAANQGDRSLLRRDSFDLEFDIAPQEDGVVVSFSDKV